MPINPALLIAAPMLQDPFVDNATDVAMSDGVVTCYQDNSRTTLKNWYYQAGVPGSYTYVTLDNPLTLSAAGTITDPNGNDTIPFFYPYDEDNNTVIQTYYITVDNSNGQRQFVRQNFPFLPPQSSISTQVPTLDNLITNNVFYHNVGTLDVSSVLNAILAPSQHDGFSAANYSDVRFIKNVTGANDVITFTPFGLDNDPLNGDITPEYYLNFNCTASQPGETLKCIQIPISLHVKTLEGVNATVTIQAQNVGGNANNTLDLDIFQFLGTGSIDPSPLITIQTLTLTNGWQKYIINFTFPSNQGLTLGDGGDDAFFLSIGLPLSITCNINFTKPSIYLSNTVPTNDFETYDQIDTVINSPRTGDTRTSINSFYPFGWVPMNDGTIGNASSNATSRANVDTWQLFNLIWTIAQPYDSGSDFNAIAQMYDSTGMAANYGATAIDDFNANNAIALTKMFGRVVLGTVPIAALLSQYSEAITASNSAGSLLITVATGSAFFNGQTIVFTTTGSLPGNIVANAVYYVANLSGNTFNVAISYADAIAGTPVIAWSSAGSNSTVTAQVTGSYIGENSHIATIAEMPAHNHPGSTITGTIQNYCAAGAASTYNTTASPTSANVQIASQGGGAGQNIMQPGTFYNIYMKL